MVTPRAGQGPTGASPLRPEPAPCCKAWAELPAERRAKWGWQVLHTWGHSRVPFTVARLAEVAGITEAAAAEAVHIGWQRKWIFRADVTAAGGADLYVGRLTARKR